MKAHFPYFAKPGAIESRGPALIKLSRPPFLIMKKLYFQFPPTTERTYVPLKALKRVNS
jgi:hypothetical protein